MVRLNLMRTGLGFGLQAFGFFWSLFDRFLCDSFCQGGTCGPGASKNCFLIFLFIGIIFVVVGYTIITMKPKKKKRLKRKFNERLNKLLGKSKSKPKKK